jgi:hypothetical protein
MNKLRAIMAIGFIIFLMVLSQAYDSYSQPMFRQGAGGYGSRGPGDRGQGDRASGQFVQGELEKIDDESVVIITSNGERKEFSRTSRTSFIKKISIDRSQILNGDSVFVMGRRIGEGSINAMMINVVEKGGGRDERPFAPQRGPVIGEVDGLDPMTVRTASGSTVTVNVTGFTKIFREENLAPSDMEPGMSVRIIAPPGRGMDKREALKVMPSEDKQAPPAFAPMTGRNNNREPRRGDFRERKQMSEGYERDSGSLLPDIEQVDLNSDFIYGIWLGRGLYSRDELDRAFRVASNLGVRHLKVEFKWSYTEKENDKYVWNNKETLDVEYLIELAGRHKMSIIPYFNMFMPWGETKQGVECVGPPNKRGQHQGPDPEEYAEHVFNVVFKLRSSGVDVRYVELDNEVSNSNDGYRSLNCFINITAKQLKVTQNKTYDRLKAKYPDMQVSSTTFSFPGIAIRDAEEHMKRRNSFIKAYFEDEPRPKFDFLGIHETLRGSGSPYTVLDKPVSGYYNFASYHDAYNIWRKVLDKYGYADKPIINLESAAVISGKQDAVLLQRVVFARANAGKNKVAGWVISQLTGSRKFTEGGGGRGVTIGITSLGSGYSLREGYRGYYTLMKTLARYPGYEGKVMGEINANRPWVEKFSDKNGNVLYVAFVPYHDGPESLQDVELNVGSDREVKVTKSDATSSFRKSGSNGILIVKAGQRPLFIEVKND